MGSRRMQNKWLGSSICHACHAFLRILSAHVCSSLNCEIGIARGMLHFHCQDSSHDGAWGKGTAFGAGERNVAGDKHSWHCNNRPNLFSIVKSWFSPTTHSLPCNTHINTVFKDTVNIITESLWIWKIHLNWDVNSSWPFLWNNCRIGLCLMLWEYGRVSDD